jgi:hypothetical protein
MSLSETRSPKELFMLYGGSLFHMHREGDYDEYKSYGVSADQESHWMNEYREAQLSAFDVDPTDSDSVSHYCDTLNLPKDSDAFRAVIRKIAEAQNDMDSFSRLRCAEELKRTVKTRKGDSVYLEATELTMALLSSVVSEPITVAKRYRDKGYLHDTLKHENIMSRAMAALNTSK